MKTKLQIVTWPATVLESVADEVTEFDHSLQEFSDAMHVAMKEANGIGLAANQVGVLKRVLVIEIPWYGERYKQTDKAKQPWHDRPYTIINPEIVEREGTITYEEGCLSFPGIFGEVERARRVLVKARNVNGGWQEIEAEDLFSVCLQHEIDHLNGIVFVNHMSRLRSDAIKKKLRDKVTTEETVIVKAADGG